MLSLKQTFLLASIFSAGWVLGREKVLQDEDLKRIIDGSWDAEQAVFRKLEYASAHSQVFWKNKKSTPLSPLNYKPADNETLLDVCTLPLHQICTDCSPVRRHRNHLSTHQSHKLQKHGLHLLQSPQHPPRHKLISPRPRRHRHLLLIPERHPRLPILLSPLYTPKDLRLVSLLRHHHLLPVP
ncbi:hypothetical protein NA56DRAFT_153947 [Hyaloscypha hepaticicola]|uniref:Uncharacterized protein n=1 Tax=Hyaloscypha hepaticicola TaxID=2082293 RepID=A0A2J6QP27_9HELO|nr:hypothetical protein NA56DRAFT_153947 [Hyaloscypha hepaticicola]